ncbi:MAG: pseudouridine synthase [Myxococcota bacterium]|nr:pseudouridine synthase [Myxococcota bacterium]
MPHGRSPRHQRTSKRRRRPAAGVETAAPAGVEDAAQERGPVRLQKLLAEAGLGSRRGCEEFVRAGRVTVNGEVAKLGDSAQPGRDRVAVDGERLAREPLTYWVAHKPAGVVTTVRDPQGRPTVMQLLPAGTPRVHPVGRLDYESTGLVLLTNDGDLTQALLHPSLGSEREYRVTVRGELDSRARKALEHGVVLEEGRTAPAKIGRVVFDSGANTTNFSFTLAEGRNRQIRRSLLTLGRPVKKLVRVRMGPLRLGTLARGKARKLRRDEVAELHAHARALSTRRRKPRAK